MRSLIVLNHKVLSHVSVNSSEIVNAQSTVFGLIVEGGSEMGGGYVSEL